MFLFDILFHQVKPDWDEIIKMYSGVTNYFIVFNQQFIGSEKTVRLLDLGEEEYFKHVPHSRNHPTYQMVMKGMYEMNSGHNRINRNIHNIWQWGIVTTDLQNIMKSNGFKEIYHINYGLILGMKTFEHHEFVFKKDV